MNQLDTESFAGLSAEKLLSIYKRHFPWMKRHHEVILRKGIEFGRTCEPPINWYYWTSLPRTVLAISMFHELCLEEDKTRGLDVLDLGACQPITAIWRHCIPDECGARFVYTTECAGHFHETSALGVFSCETVAHDLAGEMKPAALAERQFDVVMATEVIEHIDRHPQLVLLDIARLVRPNGWLLLTTPNAISWKKIYGMTNGNWGFDSPTFHGSWGHRYEYSFYEIKKLAEATGFDVVRGLAEDVYFDDHRGLSVHTQFAGILALKLLCGDVRSAAKLVLRSGSGLFFLLRKRKCVEACDSQSLIPI
jgi:SAM-dependent methyltransferase